jgi:hypothetical protein
MPAGTSSACGLHGRGACSTAVSGFSLPTKPLHTNHKSYMGCSLCVDSCLSALHSTPRHTTHTNGSSQGEAEQLIF